ncbi:hypothetical protein [Parabacteroides sp. AM08-6]|uniref:hypothetical protein n=1 Tax=Parabacteroides sp. AM08-6 TaxID=2292053 RepID=UPI000F001C8A|nr:hypothetical protein [Parabacteroides sp. AM08-6]RHJ75705.1 hypothetical protein DW103_17475 [Parabacteroides sp. AM08-6]
MNIFDKTGEKILDIPVDDTSYRYRAIRQGDKVYLYFSLIEHVEIPVYSYIEFQGQRYTLWKPENLTKRGERNLEYTVEFGGWWELLNRTKYKFLSSKPHKLKFPLTAKPRMFMQLLVDNLNLHDTGWTLGTCIDASEKALAFNHETCMEVINRFADEWNTEFEFVNKTVNFGKVEKFKDAPLPLSYGKGNGFKTGVGRQNQGEKAPVTILYVQGGERNIDVSAYGSSTLLLPKGQELEYQGKRYKTDTDGMFITRADKELVSYNEDGYDASHIYPSRVGTVSEVITIDISKNFYDIKDSTIPDTLDYSQCRIAGEKATIIFQSGILTGKEFDLEQTDDELTGYIHAERRFKIVPREIDGIIMPDTTFKPSVGDTYAIFNISLPDAYVCDNPTKSGASWEMFKEAVRYMYENEEENFTFTGELDGMWSKKRWLEIGGKLQPGGYIQFTDPQFQPDGLLIRITGIKDYINKPHSPELELSNTPVAGFVSSELGKIDSNEVKNEERFNNALSFTKRRWRDAVETLSMLEAAIAGFSAAINPITIQTMAMLVGDESLQFRFVNSKVNPREIIPDFKYNQETKIFSAPTSILQHMTLGISKLSSSHAAGEYKYWDMAAYVSPPLDTPGALYLYSKCSKSSTTGTFILSETPYKMDPGDGYYYFLTGALSSEYEAERSFVTVYGFTEILPGRITVGLIVSPNGETYFNVAQGEIGGKIVFKAGTSGYDNITDKPDLKPLYDGVNDALQDAEDASNAANEAIGLVSNKARVFYQTYAPTSGMKLNDLWVDGINIYRYNGSGWVFASKYDSTPTIIQNGLITTGAISFGGTGGMAGSGSIRIWAGGTADSAGNPVGDPTFQVSSAGDVMAKRTIKLQNNQAGITGEGTAETSVRFWAGSSTPENAPFRIYQNGNGRIGGFDIEGAHLRAQYSDDLGIMRSVRLSAAEASLVFGGSNNNSVFVGIHKGFTNSQGDNEYTDFYSNKQIIRTRVDPSMMSCIKLRAYGTFMQGDAALKVEIGTMNKEAGTTYRANAVSCEHLPGTTSYRHIHLAFQNFSNEDSWFKRTCIYASLMPTNTQLATITSSPESYSVKWDKTTGLFYVQ